MRFSQISVLRLATIGLPRSLAAFDFALTFWRRGQISLLLGRATPTATPGNGLLLPAAGPSIGSGSLSANR